MICICILERSVRGGLYQQPGYQFGNNCENEEERGPEKGNEVGHGRRARMKSSIECGICWAGGR